jgi:hypothetical protein
LHLEHRWQMSRNWRADAEYYGLSDSGFLNEYFEEDFEQEKTPESYLLLRYLRNSTYLALLYKDRANDFLTQLTQRPALAAEFVGVPLGRLVYEGSIQAGRYELEEDDELQPAPSDLPEVLRAHTEQKLSLPFSAGAFQLDPFVRALATWVDESTTPGKSAERLVAGGGLNLSATFWRAFGARSDLFGLNRLRHVITPHAGVERLSQSGENSADFLQMDAADALDEGTVRTFGLRNRLQTKRLQEGRWRSVNWMELDVSYVDRDTDSVAAQDQEYVRADFEWRLTPDVRLHSRDNRLACDDGPDVLNAGMRVDFAPGWAFTFDYDEITDTNRTLTGELMLRLSDRYDLLLYEQYELDSRGAGDDTNLETRVTLRRILHKWALEFGVKVDEADDDVSLLIGLRPLGWAGFSSSRRP